MTGYTTLVRLPVINRAPGSGIPRYKEKRPPTRINVREGANPKFIYLGLQSSEIFICLFLSVHYCSLSG